MIKAHWTEKLKPSKWKTKGQVCMHQLYLLDILFMLVFTGRKNSSKYTFVYIQRTTDHRIWISPLGIFSSSGLYCKAVGAEQKKNWSQKIPYIALYYAPCVDNSDWQG